jgi:hypothetical protein
MKPDICHVKISFEMRYKSNMLKGITWKLKTSEYPNVIAFENLFRIVILCGFQNIWSFLVFVTISTHSWLLFTFSACWLAIREEISLKSIILLFLSQISWIFFSQFESSNQVQRCMNWKDIEFQASKRSWILVLKVIWFYVDYVIIFLFHLSSLSFS